MLLHRREDAEIALHAARVVIVDVAFNHTDQLPLACKPPAVVPLTLQDNRLFSLWLSCPIKIPEYSSGSDHKIPSGS